MVLRRVRRAVGRGPNGDGYVRYSVGLFEVGVGGFVFFGGGFAKRGVRTNPRTPPWLRACLGSVLVLRADRRRQTSAAINTSYHHCTTK